MNIHFLTTLSLFSVLAIATASCGDDDSSKPATTSGTTSSTTAGTTSSTTNGTTSSTTAGTTSSTTSGTTSSTTSGTAGGSGALIIEGSTYTGQTVQCTQDVNTFNLSFTDNNGNTCDITIGTTAVADGNFTLVDNASGSINTGEAFILCSKAGDMNSYGSTNGTLMVTTVNGKKNIAFSNVTLTSANGAASINASGTFTCQ